jgi:hypothetical protein
VVIAFDGTDRAQAEETASLLGTQDELVPVPNADVAKLVSAGVARVTTPWLVITEGHCLADPACLATVQHWIDANPRAVVGNLGQGYPDYTMIGRRIASWHYKVATLPSWSVTSAKCRDGPASCGRIDRRRAQ